MLQVTKNAEHNEIHNKSEKSNLSLQVQFQSQFGSLSELWHPSSLPSCAVTVFITSADH